MRIEVGKKYRAEDGQVYGPMIYDGDGDFGEDKKGSGHLWYRDGESHTEKSGRKLVEEIKEEQIMEPKDEFTIPVLIKAKADSGWAGYSKFINAVRGKVILCRKSGFLCHEGPTNADSTGEFQSGFLPNWLESDIIPWPTKAQVEEEQAKLKPKADILPSPVREALKAADLGCRREGVEKLIEAMYSHPPKVQA